MSRLALGRLLGTGKQAEVFEYGEMVAKLYLPGSPKRSAFREAAILAIIEPFSLPVPRVAEVRRIDGRWGLIMTRMEGPSFADGLATEAEPAAEYIKEMARLQFTVHRHPGAFLPSLKARLAENIGNAPALDDRLRAVLLGRLAHMPDGAHLCHGDLHPLNIVGTLRNGSIVDRLNASSGEPAADVCRSYVLIKCFDPGWAMAHVDAYSALSGDSRDRIFDWLPLVAAARLAEDVPDEVQMLIEMAKE
jgi:aminoglycoside phosphotransferase (APT) family kinase protein